MGLFYWGEANNPRTNAPAGSGSTKTSNGSRPGRARGPMRAYFAAMVARPRDIRGLFDDPDLIYVGREWSESGWRRTPVERVALDRVCATQKWITDDGLRRHAEGGARPRGGDLPWMVCHQGGYWIFDGHHRVMCAIDRGDRHIRAHVKHPQFDHDHTSARRTR
jgi:hypothetical protein